MKYIFKVKSIFISIFILLFIFGCGAIMQQVGSLTGALLTGKTSNLSETSIQVFFLRNTYPIATQSIDVTYFKDTYRENENIVYIMVTDREGVGFFQIDGTVSIDGTVVQHIANGIYGKWIDKNDTSPKKVTIETVSGQKAEFTVSPPPPIKVVSVNGAKENAEVSIEKKLTLEMEAKDAKDSEFTVSFLTSVMGINAFVDFGTFKYKDKITIPAAMWTNPLSATSPTSGSNWLKVERFNVTPTKVSGVGASQIVGMSVDCFPVNITGEVEESWIGTLSEQGIQVNDKIITGDDDEKWMQYDLNKPNAFLGRPISSGKKFAMVSFSVRATKLQQSRTSVSSSTATYGNMQTTTTVTTTETRTFPTLPDVFWDNLVNSLYADFKTILDKNYNIELIPVEDVLKAPSYKDLEPISDNITTVEVEKSYKNTKNLIPTTLSAIIDAVSTTFASDRIDSRLLNELGVDGIIAVTIDLEMPWESFSLSPRMSIRIAGGPNGYKAGPTIYMQGVINGNGTDLDEAKMNADHIMSVLPNVIRQKDLMNALDVSFQKIKEEEKGKDYEVLWSLK